MKKVAFRLVVAVAAVALALPMMAKAPKADKADVKAKSATLTLDAPVKFGSTMVPAGTYKLVIDNEKASVESGNKVIASASGHWQEGKQKFNETGFETTNNQVDEVFMHGNSGTFVLTGSQTAKTN